jgi:hypothetical protein
MKRALGVLPVVLRELSGLGGAASTVFGVWQIYPPAGWITGGLFLIAAAVVFARAGD